MSSARSDDTTSGEEMDTILQFAEEPVTRELFPEETELTHTWLSGASQNDSSNKRDGPESCEQSHPGHISVDIIGQTTKRLDQGNDPILWFTTTLIGRDKPKNMNDVGPLQEGKGSNVLQRIESNSSVVPLECSTSSTLTDEGISSATVKSKNSDVKLNCSTSSSSTDEHKCSTTVSGKPAGTSTSCVEVGLNMNGPVVARVRRQVEGGSSSRRSYFYFCKLTGVMKIIEMIAMLLALIVTVGVDGARYFSDSLIIVNGVMLMGLTVTPTLLVCYLLKQTQIQNTFFEFIINGFLALHSVVAGCSALSPMTGSGSNVAVSVALGVLLIVAGVAYAVDCVLAILKYRTG